MEDGTGTVRRHRHDGRQQGAPLDGVELSGRGQLWLSTKSEGVYVFDRDCRLVAYLHEGAGLPSDFAMQVVSDGEGRLWIGTAEGLVVVSDVASPTETRVIGTAQGMANAHIQAIAEDGLPHGLQQSKPLPKVFQGRVRGATLRIQ